MPLTNPQPRALIVTTDAVLGAAIARHIERYDDVLVTLANTIDAARSAAVDGQLQLDGLLVDYRVSDGDGIALLEAAHSDEPGIATALMSSVPLPVGDQNRVASVGALSLRKPFAMRALEHWECRVFSMFRRRVLPLDLVHGVEALGPRERQCLELALQRHSVGEIATLLEIQVSTVRTHLERSRRKLAAAGLPQLRSRIATAELQVFRRVLNRDGGFGPPRGREEA